MSVSRTKGGIVEKGIRRMPDPTTGKPGGIAEDDFVAPSGPSKKNNSPVRFRDSVWELTWLKKRPSPTDRVLLDFRTLPETWQLTAKEVIFFSLHPNHPLLVEAGLSGRGRPAAPITARGRFAALKTLAEWATREGLGPVSTWDPKVGIAFLEHICQSAGPSTNHARIGTLRLLHTYRLVITGGGIQKLPWPSSMSSASVVGYSVPSTVLQTAPLAPESWRNNVAGAWAFVDKFSESILEARAVFERVSPGSPGVRDPASNSQTVLQALAIPLRKEALQTDGNPRINYPLLTRFLLGAKDGAACLQPSVYAPARKLMREVKTYEDSAFEHAAHTGGRIQDGWIPRMSHGEIKELGQHLMTACYIVVAAFSMMRNSEVRGIRQGSIVDHFGIPAIKSTKYKRDQSGRDYFWWVSDPVIRAIHVAERLNETNDYLFGSTLHSGSDRPRRHEMGPFRGTSISTFVEFVNAHSEQLELSPMSLPLNARVLRRTMATIVAGAEDGQIALALQLKHATNYAVANALTSAYGEPDARWIREMSQSRQAAAVARTVNAWASGDVDRAFSGPGSSVLQSCFKDYSANDQPVKGDRRLLERWLAGRFPKMRLGTLNHCLGDSSVAACLAPAARERGDSPDPTFCKPATCRNAFCDENQRKVIATELDMVRNLREMRHASAQTQRTLQDRENQLIKLIEAN